MKNEILRVKLRYINRLRIFKKITLCNRRQNVYRLLEELDLFISPMVGLELQCLDEIDRITVEASKIVEYLAAAIDLTIWRISLHRAVMEAMDLDWTRDPFDRLIVAQAQVGQEQPITKDKNIHANASLVAWG